MDLGCEGIASHIQSLSDVEVFHDYFNLLLRGARYALPSFVLEDVKAVGAPNVLNALDALSRLCLTDAQATSQEESAFSSFLNGNFTCGDRIKGYLNDLAEVLNYEEFLASFGFPETQVDENLYPLLNTDWNTFKFVFDYLCLSSASTVSTQAVGTYRRRLFSWEVASLRKSSHVDDIPEYHEENGVSVAVGGVTQGFIPETAAMNLPLSFTQARAYMGGQVLLALAYGIDYALRNGLFPVDHPLMMLRVTASSWLSGVEKHYAHYMKEANASGLYHASVPIDLHGKYEKLNTRKQRYEFNMREDQGTTAITLRPYKRSYCVCRLTSVPKSFTKRRTITPISQRLYHDTYYPSRALKYALEKCLPQHFCFYDQTMQWKRLINGWKSADASSASDLIDCMQVVACYPTLWKELMTTRPTHVEVNGNYFCLLMFGAMGHNMTFPAENTVFVVAALSHRLFCCTYHGDDGTFKPVPDLENRVINLYKTYGWKLNVDKSFLREDCDVAEACGLYRVGDVFFRLFRWSRGMSPMLNASNVVSAISMQHCCFSNKWERARQYLDDVLSAIGVTASSSRSPYSIWRVEAPSYLAFHDGKAYVTETAYRMHYPSVAKEDPSLFDAYKHYMLRTVPDSFMLPDYKRRVLQENFDFTYVPVYDRPSDDPAERHLEDFFVHEDPYEGILDITNNGAFCMKDIGRRTGPLSYDSIVQVGVLVLENREIEEIDQRFVNSGEYLRMAKVTAKPLHLS
jgi:hypothetical protein